MPAAQLLPPGARPAAHAASSCPPARLCLPAGPSRYGGEGSSQRGGDAYGDGHGEGDDDGAPAAGEAEGLGGSDGEAAGDRRPAAVTQRRRGGEAELTAVGVSS